MSEIKLKRKRKPHSEEAKSKMRRERVEQKRYGTEGQVNGMSDFKITKCTGEGQGSCKRCNDHGIWNRHWMSMLYKIEGYEGCYCSECVKKIMEGNQNE